MIPFYEVLEQATLISAVESWRVVTLGWGIGQILTGMEYEELSGRKCSVLGPSGL